MAPKKRLGEMLIDAGVIDETQLKAALGHQRQWGVRLGQALVDLKLASEADVVRALSVKFGFGVASLDALEPYALEQALALLPRDFALRNNVFPMAADTASITVAMSDPSNLAVVDEIRFRTGRRVKVNIGGDREVAEALRRHYPGDQVEAIALDIDVDEGETHAVYDPFGGGSKDALEAFFSPAALEAEPAPQDLAPAPPAFAAAAPRPAPAPAPAPAAAAPARAAPAPAAPAAPAATPARPSPAPASATAARPAPQQPQAGTLPRGPAPAPPRPGPASASPAPAALPGARTVAAPTPAAQASPAAAAPRPAARPAPAPPAASPRAPVDLELDPAAASSGPPSAREEPRPPPADPAFSPQETAILAALERLARGAHAEPEILRPTHAMAVVVRILLRKGIVSERELLDGLSGKVS
jgi:hypothetical protein